MSCVKVHFVAIKSPSPEFFRCRAVDSFAKICDQHCPFITDSAIELCSIVELFITSLSLAGLSLLDRTDPYGEIFLVLRIFSFSVLYDVPPVMCIPNVSLA